MNTSTKTEEKNSENEMMKKFVLQLCYSLLLHTDDTLYTFKSFAFQRRIISVGFPNTFFFQIRVQLVPSDLINYELWRLYAVFWSVHLANR